MTEREGTNEPGGADEIGAAHDALLSRRDAVSDLSDLSDLSEQDAMRLQSTMDRRAKAHETLSNVMKKASDTQESITDNLK